MSKLSRMLLRSFEEGKSIWEIYPNKSNWWKIKHAIYLSPVSDIVLKPWYKICHFYSKIERVVAYFPILWNMEEWDNSYTTKLWAFSLKRLKRGCIDKGHHVVSKGELRSFKVAIALLERMSDDNQYTEKHMEAFYKKWGESDYDFKVCDLDKNGKPFTYTMHNKTEEALSERDRKLYNKERSAIWAMEKTQFEQDVDLFAKVLKKYLRKWWD